MSWDVLIFSGQGAPSSVSAIPDDWRPHSMGDAEEVRNLITTALPGTDWSDPAWGILDGADWSIEFNYNKTGPVDSFMLHIRGGGDPIAAITGLCRANGWIALDTSTGEFMDLTDPSRDGWDGFKKYRDQVLHQKP
jgi:hypothetical protein